jgi:hypothetical protein
MKNKIGEIKFFCRMFGLVMIEVMTPSGHLSNISEIALSIKDKSTR